MQIFSMMFLKPYKVKSNAPLKSSDLKKLKQRIQNEFSNANVDLLIAPKSNVVLLKLVTHGNFQTDLYCADKVPIFFENEENKLVPTLYSLWQVTDLLPYFTTHTAVFPKLTNGADLMLSGVIAQGTGMSVYGHYKKGQLVAVNLTSNQSAVGIGYLPKSSNDLYMSGGHGVAVKMLHLFGDKLWAHEPSVAQQVPQFKKTKLTSEDFPALGSNSISNKKNEVESTSQKNNLTKVENSISEKDQGVLSEDVSNDIKLENSKQQTSDSTPENLLKHAFLSALKKQGKNMQLPLLTSNFFRLYVVPEAQEPLDLKKTKYKKLSNFLNEMIDEGFIVVREETKGVDKITSIDLDHPELVNFITDYEEPMSSTGSKSENPLFHSELMELYIVTDATASFFTKLNYQRGSGLPASQIKKVVRDYVNKQNLSLSKDLNDGVKSYVLDECLEKICHTKVASLSKIINGVISQMDHSYQMCIAKDVKSNKPMIQMSLATRSGNKKVTLVSNVECYGIILAEFIKLCKQGAAASTTIVTLPNQNREMLQIQGNQVRFIYTLLTETYKIPPKCILGLDLAKDGKKNKKK